MSAALPTHPTCRTVLTLATAVGLMMGAVFGQVQEFFSSDAAAALRNTVSHKLPDSDRLA